MQDILENDLEETERRKQQEQEHILAEIAKVSLKGTVFRDLPLYGSRCTQLPLIEKLLQWLSGPPPLCLSPRTA